MIRNVNHELTNSCSKISFPNSGKKIRIHEIVLFYSHRPVSGEWVPSVFGHDMWHDSAVEVLTWATFSPIFPGLRVF